MTISTKDLQEMATGDCPCESCVQTRALSSELLAARVRADIADDLLEALKVAEAHFGPFAEITINGLHDPDDVRVVAMIRATIAKATGAA